jgi:hypothetical protein
MPILTAGLTHMVQATLGEAVTAFNNANAYLAVGNGTAAFSAAHTDLQGASKARKAMDATYPQRSGLQMTFRSSFASADANFAWEEWGIANASTAGTMLNRVVAANGTKASGATWVFTVTLTPSLA